MAQFVVMSLSKETLLEIGDNYQKQTYRNRMYLYSANGKQLLTVPIRHSKSPKERQLYCDVLIDSSVPWQRNHLRTLQAAYRCSAYYEYFEDHITAFFDAPFERLIDCNLASISLVLDCLKVAMSYEVCYDNDENLYKNYKGLTNRKTKICDYNFESYFQVFSDRYGYIENLSILDLLFNIGPQVQDYLLRQRQPDQCL